MSSDTSNSNEKLLHFIKIVDGLAELHEWEVKNHPLLSTLTGRLLYFRITQRIVGNRGDLSKPLKNLIIDTSLTEKALRNRLHEMERNGYIVMKEGDVDGRSKYPVPTELFNAAVFLHAEKTRHIFGKDYLVIDK